MSAVRGSDGIESRVNKDERVSSGYIVDESSLLIDRFVREPLALELNVF